MHQAKPKQNKTFRVHTPKISEGLEFIMGWFLHLFMSVFQVEGHQNQKLQCAILHPASCALNCDCVQTSVCSS